MASSNEKLIDIIWSPVRDDEFVCFGNDLYLFRVKNNKKSTSKLNIKLSDISFL
jgi:hypothetical protein